jgi:hypothetical protein
MLRRLQLCLLAGLLLAYFLLTSGCSWHAQRGLWDAYLRQHRAAYGLAVMTAALVAGVGAYRLVCVNMCTLSAE